MFCLPVVFYFHQHLLPWCDISKIRNSYMLICISISFQQSLNREVKKSGCLFYQVSPGRKLKLDVVQLLSRVQLFATPQTAACWAFLSFTIYQSLLKLMSIRSVMLSNHLVLCHPLLRLPSVFEIETVRRQSSYSLWAP